MPSARRSFGDRAERLTAWRLWWRGYRILARNWTCARGEVDIIARHRGALVFIEVKARVSEGRLPPEAQVGFDKQRRLSRLADAYRRQHNAWEQPVRFDVVGVVLSPRGRVQAFRVWPDAFEYVEA